MKTNDTPVTRSIARILPVAAAIVQAYKEGIEERGAEHRVMTNFCGNEIENGVFVTVTRLNELRSAVEDGSFLAYDEQKERDDYESLAACLLSIRRYKIKHARTGKPYPELEYQTDNDVQSVLLSFGWMMWNTRAQASVEDSAE